MDEPYPPSDDPRPRGGLKRRDALKLGIVGALGSAGLMVPLSAVTPASAKDASDLRDQDFPRPFGAAFRRPPRLRPYETGEDAYGRYARYSVTERLAEASIIPGLMTPIAGYNGVFPGPTIRVEAGVRTELRVRNRMAVNPFYPGDFRTSTHLHGHSSLPQYDGYASDLCSPNNLKTYKYHNLQHGRTIWYHDHAAHTTAQNVYAGLAGMYVISDSHERAQLPQGEYDVPLILSDAIFARDGRLVFEDGGVDEHDGVWGDVVMVNGVPWPTMQVKPRVYRFRVLNASVARSYRPTLSDGSPLHLVATDAGMVPRPVALPSYRHGNGERYEVLIDFRGHRPGDTVDLLNLSNANNDDYDHTDKLMRFQVVEDVGAPDPYVLPTVLDPGPFPYGRDVMELSEADVTYPRRRRLTVNKEGDPEEWVVNDRTWHDVEASGFTLIEANPQPGAVEIWDVENTGGGWFHPMHLHLIDFKVIGRNTNGGQPFAWERGPKDTVYVGENERVQLLCLFDLPPGNDGGRYMIHCHNLSHEDHDMMVQYAVGDPTVNDPIESDRAKWDDLPDDIDEYEADEREGTEGEGGAGGEPTGEPTQEPTTEPTGDGTTEPTGGTTITTTAPAPAPTPTPTPKSSAPAPKPTRRATRKPTSTRRPKAKR